MSEALETHQKRQYEKLYQERFDAYGIPDRKISETDLENHKLLSLGSGAGNDIWYLCDRNLVVGVDYARNGLVIGKQHGLHGILAELNFRTTLPFKNESFDIVICKDIFEHLLEPMAILREVRRCLKNDGYIIISVPNHFYLPFRMRILFGKGLIWKSLCSDHQKDYDEWNYMHIRFFTFIGFVRFLSEAEFKPEKWFWDFGTLAHYQNPDMWLEPQLWKESQGLPLSSRGKLGLRLIKPLWDLLNFIFPRPFRSFIVSISPGVLCAGFYVRARKSNRS